MNIINDTPFEMATMPGRMPFPGHSLTLLIKGTFDLVPGGTAKEAAEQPCPDGDAPYPDDEEDEGAPRYETDFCQFKPKADLLLVGRCFPPSPPATACETKFAVGKHAKSLAVTGDQLAKRGAKSKFRPFDSMELRYEKAYGGAEFPANPVGVGDPTSIKAAGLEQWPLPNFRIPRAPTRPAGFGPLSRMWKDRLDKVGSYDEEWVETRWPWFPKDFDWSFFNIAPADQQVKYLTGDETIRCENLHPEHAVYESKLPGLRVRGFFLVAKETGEPPEFRELELNLDTLWVDMEAEQATLVWRGFTDVSGEEFPEVSDIFITSEKLADEPATVAACQARFGARCEELGLRFELEPEPEVGDDAASAEVSPELHGERAAELAAAGVTPEAPAAAEQKAADRRREVLSQIEAREALDGADLTGLDLAGLDLSGLSMRGAILAEANLEETILSKADLSEANLAAAKLSGCQLQEAKLVEADLGGADLNGADLTGAILDGATFEAAKLTGAVLDRVSGKGVIFNGAELTGATLRESVLPSAYLVDTALGQADFGGADLTSANLQGASGAEVNMAAARLENLRGDDCQLLASNFANVAAFDSGWIRAKLDQADFSGAILGDADFEAASLERAVFRKAVCKEASFNKSVLRGADLRQADLLEGDFDKADLTRANFAGSNLFGANFMDAVLVGLNLMGANVTGTQLDPTPKPKPKGGTT